MYYFLSGNNLTNYDGITSIKAVDVYNNYPLFFQFKASLFPNLNTFLLPVTSFSFVDSETLETINITPVTLVPGLSSFVFEGTVSSIPNLKNLTIRKSLTLPTLSNITINLTASSQLKHLQLEGLDNTDLNISQNPAIRRILLRTLPHLSSLNLTTYSELSYVSLQILPNLSFISNQDNIIDKFIESFYSRVSANPTSPKDLQDSGIIYNQSITNTSFVSRTSASEDQILTVFKNVRFLVPYEVDSTDTIIPCPSGYIPATINSYTLLNTISSTGGGVYVMDINRQATNPVVLFPALSGEYVKTNTVLNQRDVFKNNQDYFLLFNNSLSAWTIVGPTSASSTIWLSALDMNGGASYYGDPPMGGWRGPAYTINGWGYNYATYGAYCFQGTCLFPTSRKLFNNFNVNYEGGPNGQQRISYNPSSGYNPNFFKPHQDYSGILHGSLTGPGPSSRCYLISPIHFLWCTHFGAPSPLYKFNYDGTVQTRTILSAAPVYGDIGVGILNAPVSGTFFALASGDYYNGLYTKQDLNRLFIGPNQDGRVGQFIPTDNYNRFGTSSILPLKFSTNWSKIYTIPKNFWHSEEMFVGGDSSTCLLYDTGSKLVLLGHVFSPDGSGPYYGKELFPGDPMLASTSISSVPLTITQKMTALSEKFFGSGIYDYKPDFYNFVATNLNRINSNNLTRINGNNLIRIQ